MFVMLVEFVYGILSFFSILLIELISKVCIFKKYYFYVLWYYLIVVEYEIYEYCYK